MILSNKAAAGAALVVLVPLLVGLFLPSQRLMPDGLDELMVIEAPKLEINGKHPATEAGLWLGFKTLKTCGYAGKAIRPVQLWNALWLTVALGGLLAATRAWLGKGRLAAFACLPFLSVSLHWATDPFLPYWPPGLAALSWALVLAAGKPRRGRHLGLIALLALMAFLNPICVLALPAVAYLAAGQTDEEPRARRLRLGSILVLPPLLLLIYLSTLDAVHSPVVAGGTAGLFGSFTAERAPQAFTALQDAFFTPRDQLKLYFPRWGDLVKSGCNALLLAAAGFLLLSLSRGERRPRFRPLLWALPSLLAIMWWAPQQRFFYLLPIWLLFALWPAKAEEEEDQAAWPPAAKKARAGVLLLPALILALVNGISYLRPVQDEDPRRAWIVACAKKFQPADRLYLPHFGDATFTYFGGLETASLLERFRRRLPGQPTLDSMRGLIEERRQAGGRIYFQVPRKNQQWVPREIRERAQLDYDDAAILARFVWGEEIDCGQAKFRRLVAIR